MRASERWGTSHLAPASKRSVEDEHQPDVALYDIEVRVAVDAFEAPVGEVEVAQAGERMEVFAKPVGCAESGPESPVVIRAAGGHSAIGFEQAACNIPVECAA